MADKIDKPLNAVPVVTSDDINQIEALFAKMSNGEIKVVTKADLAGVVAACLNSNMQFPFMDRGYKEGVDLDTLKTPGFYYVTSPSISKFGVLAVFKSGWGVGQIHFDVFTGAFTKRVLLHNNGAWDKWSNWS